MSDLLKLLAAGYGFREATKDPEFNQANVGFQGEIPDYDFVREQVQDTYLPDRVPGSRGQRYFSDYTFTPPAQQDTARQTAFNQALDLRKQNLARAEQDYFDPTQTTPTGIQSIVGSNLDYSTRNPEETTDVDRTGSTPTNYISSSGKTYTTADVRDTSQFQFFGDGVAYAPGYGFFNLDDPAEVSTFYAFAAGQDAEGSQDDGSQDDGSQDDGSQDDGSQDDGSQDDGSQDDGSQDDAAGRFKTRYGISVDNATAVLDNMIFGTEGQSPSDYPDIPTGSGLWRQMARNLLYKDANGRYITEVERETPTSGVATAVEKFAFDFNGVKRYTPNKFRSLSDTDRAAIHEIARDISVTPDGAPVSVPEQYASGENLNYLNFVLSFVGPNGKTFTPPTTAKTGGLMSLRGGGYLSGSTDGMADQINTTIEGTQPAALSDGEFVIAADVVSHLGNGNSDAGADVLYNMMADIRKARTGNSKQGTQINPNSYLPNRGIA